jgi:hypothetical protein
MKRVDFFEVTGDLPLGEKGTEKASPGASELKKNPPS